LIFGLFRAFPAFFNLFAVIPCKGVVKGSVLEIDIKGSVLEIDIKGSVLEIDIKGSVLEIDIFPIYWRIFRVFRG